MHKEWGPLEFRHTYLVPKCLPARYMDPSGKESVIFPSFRGGAEKSQELPSQNPRASGPDGSELRIAGQDLISKS